MIYFDDNEFYSNEAIILKRAVTVEEDRLYFYEFIVKDNEALIKASDNKYIEDAANFFHRKNTYIYKIRSIDDSFYQEFSFVYSFKLPINILQPSALALSEKRIEELESLEEIDVKIPVAILDDEYVILDGHHFVKTMANSFQRMVEVYLADKKGYISDLVYICKEQNIKNINKLELLSDDDYSKYLEAIEGIC